MVKRTAQLEALTSVAVINSILTAVPSPAFALGANKKILAFNTAFQTLVRRQFPVLAEAEQRGDLKLALDINVADLMARLDQNGNTAVLTGFAIGIGDRRFRGQLNAVKAPSIDVEIRPGVCGRLSWTEALHSMRIGQGSTTDRLRRLVERSSIRRRTL